MTFCNANTVTLPDHTRIVNLLDMVRNRRFPFDDFRLVVIHCGHCDLDTPGPDVKNMLNQIIELIEVVSPRATFIVTSVVSFAHDQASKNNAKLINEFIRDVAYNHPFTQYFNFLPKIIAQGGLVGAYFAGKRFSNAGFEVFSKVLCERLNKISFV